MGGYATAHLPNPTATELRALRSEIETLKRRISELEDERERTWKMIDGVRRNGR